MNTGFFAGPRPRVFGHRGAAGEVPENTIPSFDRALACGADVLELDVHASRDGTVVVIHDPTLDRTTDGAGPVRDRTWSELAALDAGWHFTADGDGFPFRRQGLRIPALAEVLGRYREARFNIEVKQDEPPIAAEVVRLVLAHGCADRALLAAEHPHIMEEIRDAAAGRVVTGFSAAEVAEFIDHVQRGTLGTYRPAGRALQIPAAFGGIELVTPETVRAAHALGVEMHVWTVNDRDEMNRLLALGVDGIISDLPAVARAAVDARRARS